METALKSIPLPAASDIHSDVTRALAEDLGSGDITAFAFLDEDGAAAFGVRDTGVGIPPDVQARLFEFFFTTKEDGSGLGLYISYGIVESHHGQIRVESRPGLGTTFTILLPVQQPSRT